MPFTNYTISVVVVNTAGRGPLGEAVSVVTAEGGKSLSVHSHIVCVCTCELVGEYAYVHACIHNTCNIGVVIT